MHARVTAAVCNAVVNILRFMAGMLNGLAGLLMPVLKYVQGKSSHGRSAREICDPDSRNLST